MIVCWKLKAKCLTFVWGIVIVKYQLEIWMLGWTVSLFTPTPILTFIWVASLFVPVSILLVRPWTRSWSLLMVMMVPPLCVLLPSPRPARRRRIRSGPLIARPPMRRHPDPPQVPARSSFSRPVPLTDLDLDLPPIDAITIQLVSGFDGIGLEFELGEPISPWHFDFLRIILRGGEWFVDDVAVV